MSVLSSRATGHLVSRWKYNHWRSVSNKIPSSVSLSIDTIYHPSCSSCYSLSATNGRLWSSLLFTGWHGIRSYVANTSNIQAAFIRRYAYKPSRSHLIQQVRTSTVCSPAFDGHNTGLRSWDDGKTSTHSSANGIRWFSICRLTQKLSETSPALRVLSSIAMIHAHLLLLQEPRTAGRCRLHLYICECLSDSWMLFLVYEKRSLGLCEYTHPRLHGYIILKLH